MFTVISIKCTDKNSVVSLFFSTVMNHYAALSHMLSKVDLRGFKIWLEKMTTFKGRLETFKNWNSPFISPAELAASGFYFTEWEDCCKCFACGLMVCEWEAGDTADGEHSKHNGRCCYMKCKERAGVEDPDVYFQRNGILYHDYDVCGRRSVIDTEPPGCGLYRRVLNIRDLIRRVMRPDKNPCMLSIKKNC